MRHLKAGRKLNRNPSHRRALMRNLVTALLRHERVSTTDAKAKELRQWADWMIGLAKQGTLHARRQALAVIPDKAVVKKLFDTLAGRYQSRPGGYTRTVKTGWRHGDHAPLSVVELVGGGEEAKAKSPPRRRRRRASAQKEEASTEPSGAST